VRHGVKKMTQKDTPKKARKISALSKKVDFAGFFEEWCVKNIFQMCINFT